MALKETSKAALISCACAARRSDLDWDTYGLKFEFLSVTHEKSSGREFVLFLKVLYWTRPFDPEQGFLHNWPKKTRSVVDVNTRSEIVCEIKSGLCLKASLTPLFLLSSFVSFYSCTSKQDKETLVQRQTEQHVKTRRGYFRNKEKRVIFFSRWPEWGYAGTVLSCHFARWEIVIEVFLVIFSSFCCSSLLLALVVAQRKYPEKP